MDQEKYLRRKNNKMMGDIGDIKLCEKCGIYFSLDICMFETAGEYTYYSHRVAKCPVCGERYFFD